MKKTKRKYSKDRIVFISILLFFLGVYALSMLFVLGWGIVTSFKSFEEFSFGKDLKGNLGQGNVLGFPADWYLKNYTTVFSYLSDFNTQTSFYFGSQEIYHESTDNLFTMIVNSVLYAGVGSLLQAAIPALVAYLCAKFKYKFSGFLYVLVVTTMTIPIIGNQASMITTLRGLGLYDSFLGYFIMKSGFGGMYFLIFYAFFQSFPDSYEEAAEIDGANHYTILVRIILPLSVKIVGTVFLIQFVQYWNDYQTALLYMPTHPTIAYVVNYYAVETQSGAMSQPPAKIAMCMLLAVPVLILFVIFKDKIMGNVTIGGIKG